MYEINERVKKIRKYFRLSQATFAKKIGVATSSVGNWEIGIREIKPVHVTVICNVFKINKEWLLYGTGEMLIRDNSNNPAFVQITKEYNLSTTQAKFMKAFLSLTNEQKDTIIEAMQIMVEATLKKDTVTQSVPYNFSHSDNELTVAQKRALVNRELDDEEKSKSNIDINTKRELS